MELQRSLSAFPLKNGKTLRLSVLWFAGAVMNGVNGKPGGKKSDLERIPYVKN